MNRESLETGTVVEILPKGFTYRIRLSDSRVILCVASRDYYGDRRTKVPKKEKPAIGDVVHVRLMPGQKVEGQLVRIDGPNHPPQL